MAGVNKVILIGHMGKDPEVRKIAGDIIVARFPFATTETIAKNGKKIEFIEWHNVVVWRSLAEIAGKMLRKGSLVHLEGKIRTRSFTDSTGVIKYTAEVIVEQFTILGRKGDFIENSIG